jgi:small subunit ribosomal protein S16
MKGHAVRFGHLNELSGPVRAEEICMIRIRLRRIGKTHHASYRMVVANKTAKRDGAFLETLGSYDPHSDPPTVNIDAAKTLEWIGKGAQPSEAAEKLLRRAGILAAPAVADVAKAEPETKPKRRSAAAAVAAKPAAAAAVAEAPVAVAEPVAEAAVAAAEPEPEPAVAVAEPEAEVEAKPVRAAAKKKAE